MKRKTLTIFKEMEKTISTFFSNFAFDSVGKSFKLTYKTGIDAYR